jgi:MarR family transcriptional repressor of emrRAB
MPLSQLIRVEANLRNLAQQVPELPANEALLLRLVVILGRDINALLERAIKPAALSEAEFRMMMALYSHQGDANGGLVCAGEVCAALAQSPANLTRLSDSLVQRGYITRRPDTADRRRMLLALEPKGKELLGALLPRISADISAAFTDLPVAERKQLLASLKSLMAGIDRLGGNA